MAEPKLYPDNQANADGVLEDAPRPANGSVHVRTAGQVERMNDAWVGFRAGATT